MTVARLFDYDIAPILAVLPEFDTIWHEETWRQHIPTPDRGADIISLRRQPGSRARDLAHQIASVATRHLSCAPLTQAIDAICEHVEGRPARASLVRLRPGVSVEPHIDAGIYCGSIERFLLPVVTNPYAWVMVDDVRYHLEPGRVFALDKEAENAAGNDGLESVIFLQVDAHPESAAVFAG